MGGQSSVASGLDIGLLGSFAATHDGVPLDLGGPRQRAVLAMLVLHRGRLVSADQIVENLWADERPANAFASLQSYVSHLRRRLEPDVAARARSGVIERQANGYCVRVPEDAVDAWRFEQLLAERGGDEVARLTGALRLWRGAALADYCDETWAQAEITRLEELRSVARERLAGARLHRGEAEVLVGELEAMVNEAPLREERWRLLSLALYRAQRQADALGALRRARQTFADELGVDPGPVLRALEADILAQAPGLDVRATATAPVATVAPIQTAAPPAPVPVQKTRIPNERRSDLVERERELSTLEDALDQLQDGRSVRVLVEGPAGIGKTRLLEELGRRAAGRGVTVLAAHGSQLEQSFGYGVVRQLLESVVTDELLCGAGAAARGVFDLAGGHREGSLAVLHALYSVTARLAAERPLLISVDNLQWVDPPSLRYLAYLARRMDGWPALVAATIRTGEADEIDDLVAEIAFDTDTLLVRPQPLSEEATQTLAERAYGQPAADLFVAACYRTTSGNPLLLRQLLQALVAQNVKPDAAHTHSVLAVGSRAVSSQVLLRLRRMSEECRRVARSIAVLSDASQLPCVAALAGLSEWETASAIAILTRAQLLRDEDPLGFAHPIVAEAIYRDMPAAERGLQHERAAALLKEGGASAEEIAAHLLLAPTRGSASTVELLAEAARIAADRGATDSAVTYLRRALEEPPDNAMRPAIQAELDKHEQTCTNDTAVDLKSVASSAGHALSESRPWRTTR
jgi:DNA-binding SARP family transcriptional activator